MLFNTVILLGLLSQVATKNCKIATNNPTFGSTYDLVPSQTKNAASVAAGFNELSVVGKITVVDACTFNFSFKHGDVTGSTTRDAGLTWWGGLDYNTTSDGFPIVDPSADASYWVFNNTDPNAPTSFNYTLSALVQPLGQGASVGASWEEVKQIRLYTAKFNGIMYAYANIKSVSTTPTATTSTTPTTTLSSDAVKNCFTIASFLLVIFATYIVY